LLHPVQHPKGLWAGGQQALVALSGERRPPRAKIALLRIKILAIKGEDLAISVVRRKIIGKFRRIGPATTVSRASIGTRTGLSLRSLGIFRADLAATEAASH